MDPASLKYQTPQSAGTDMCDRTPSEQTLVKADQLSRGSLESSNDLPTISSPKRFAILST